MPDYTAVGVSPPRASKARPPQFGPDLKDEALQRLGSTLSSIGERLAAQQQKNAAFDADSRFLQFQQNWSQHLDQATHGPTAQVNPVVDPVPPSNLPGPMDRHAAYAPSAPAPAADKADKADKSIIGLDSMGRKRVIDPTVAQPIPPPLVPSQQNEPFNLRPWGGGDAP